MPTKIEVQENQEEIAAEAKSVKVIEEVETNTSIAEIDLRIEGVDRDIANFQVIRQQLVDKRKLISDEIDKK